MLEDQVEDLLSKIDLLDVLKGETAQLKAQVDALTSVSVSKRLNTCTYLLLKGPQGHLYDCLPRG